MQWIKAFLFAGTAAFAVVLLNRVRQSTKPHRRFTRLHSPPLPSAWSWDGLYTSVSAGGTLTHGNLGKSRNDPTVNMSQSFSNGALTNANVQTGTNTFSGNEVATGRARFSLSLGVQRRSLEQLSPACNPKRHGT